MKLDGSHFCPQAPATVFALLLDPLFLQRAISGCERMERVGEDQYNAHLKIGAGMIKGNYIGKVRITEKEPPQKLILQMEGRGSPGFVNGAAVVELTAEGQGTRLNYRAEVTVGGMIAMVGSRMIEAAAKKLAAEFFQNITSQTPGA